MVERPFHVLAVATHPVQYAVPLFRLMAQHPKLDFRVAYCSLSGAEPAHDAGFGATVQWDIPLLDGYDWVQIPNRGSGDQSFLGFRNPGLWKLIREGHFDAILCYVGYLRASFWIAFFAARLSGAAFLFGTDAATLDPPDARAWKGSVKKIFWPRLFRLADQVLALSPAGVDLMRSLSIPEDRISLTPFVVDNDWWTAQSALADRQAVRNSWGVSERDLAVLFCAKLQSWKRPSDLLRAFAGANVSNSVLIFAGEGPLRAQLEAESAALGVRDRVRFLGFVNQSQLPGIYTSADLFVLPSDYDACPVVVCEAMLCGLPVVLSDRIRGRFDLVRPGGTGDIFPCGDVVALAALLRKLLADRSHLAVMSENARARMTTFSPRENITAALDAIARAVQHRNPAGFSGKKLL
jgi:glycosyltransferase involved in cell wall biosynthesis